MNNFLVYDSIDFQISKRKLFALYSEARTSLKRSLAEAKCWSILNERKIIILTFFFL